MRATPRKCMSSYEKRVADNLARMGAPASEWSAIAAQTVEIADAPGGQRSMPVFEFPDGYAPAPSMFKASGSSCCCELCGEDIKNVYWLKNDEKKWTMPVGSECVTHFGEGLSGSQIQKQAQWARNRELLSSLQTARKELWKEFATRSHVGYGRSEMAISPWQAFGREAQDLRKRMVSALGSLDAESSPDASITRWARKNGEQAKSLVAEFQTMRAARESRLAAKAAQNVQPAQSIR